jgi:hypothetical protein
MLLDELKLHRADADHLAVDDLIFCTTNETPLDRSNIRTRISGKAVEAANPKLVAAVHAMKLQACKRIERRA